MTAYCIYPRQVEMLVKAGLYGPLEDLVFDRKKNADAINWAEPDIRKAMVLSRQDLSELTALRPPMEAMKVRALARRWFGESWSVRDTLDFYNEFSGPPAVDFLRLCRKYALKPGKAYDYLEFQACYDPDLPWMSMADLLVLYRDYLDAAYLLGRCMEHSKVLFPRDLLQAHDEEIELLQVEQSAISDKSEGSLIAGSAKERREKYSFELDGLRIVFPVTAAEIKREGEALSHCVGGYAQRHMKNALTILFLRKTSAPHEPYVTIEMHGDRMMQCYGYKNDVGKRIKPRDLHRDFFDTWLAWLKAGSRRDKNGKPVLPKRKREAKIA